MIGLNAANVNNVAVGRILSEFVNSLILESFDRAND